MKKIIFLLFLIAVSTTFATTIYDIQFTTTAGPDGTYPSSYAGQTVTVEGIVVAVDFKGYKDNIFISMPDGGAWSGIYVYACGDTSLVVGDNVEITADVTEYYGLTELTNVSSITLLSSGNPIPAPLVVPTSTLVDPVDAEPYEGCLVELNNVVVTSEQNSYGEWYVADASAIPCQMDDGFFYLNSLTPPIVINVGDPWAILRGMVAYSYDEYEVNPRTPDDMIATIPLDADFSATPLTGTAPLEVDFTDESTGNITSWEWDFDNDGTIDSNEQNPTYVYNTPGTYTVSLTVSDGTNTDIELKTDYIVVDTEVVAEFSASPLAGYAPLEVSFTDESTGNITSWEWDFDNDGTIDSNEQNPVYEYNTAGLYTVSLTVSDGTITDTETKIDYITVGESVVADFYADPLVGNAPLEVSFTDESSGDITSWAWDFDNDGTIDSNEQNPVYAYTEEGLYSVSLTVSDGTMTDTMTRTDYIQVSNVGAEIVISNISRLNQNYPNPFNPVTEIFFQIAEGEQGELKIFNSKGQLILSKNFDYGIHRFEWNADAQSSGVYFLQLVTESYLETKKMILLK